MLEHDIEALQYLLVRLLEYFLDFVGQHGCAPGSQHRVQEVLVDWAVWKLAVVVSDGLLVSLFVFHDVLEEVLHLLSQLRIEIFDILLSFTDLYYVLAAHDIIQVCLLG